MVDSCAWLNGLVRAVEGKACAVEQAGYRRFYRVIEQIRQVGCERYAQLQLADILACLQRPVVEYDPALPQRQIVERTRRLVAFGLVEGNSVRSEML